GAGARSTRTARREAAGDHGRPPRGSGYRRARVLDDRCSARGWGRARVYRVSRRRSHSARPRHTAAGKTGFYGEQAAEFLAPMGAIGKATKAERMITRMAAEAAGSGGVAALQSGGDPRQMATAAALGAVAPPVGAAVGATVRAAQRAAAGAAEGGI